LVVVESLHPLMSKNKNKSKTRKKTQTKREPQQRNVNKGCKFERGTTKTQKLCKIQEK